MNKKILIIGNGFDLDIGMKTRYRDFMESGIWRKTKEHDNALSYSILKYLEEKNRLESWFDVENELLNYALEISEGTYRSPQETDRRGFELFQNKLKEYIQIEQETFITRVASTAIASINNILCNGFFTNIYSFNYTDLSKFMSRLNIKVSIPISYIHGSLGKNDNIVLGIETDKKIHKDYKFLFKTNSRFYSSNDLNENMDEANEIVFWGHSINGMDFPYFKDFFTKQSLPSEGRNRKKITIFTYDGESEECIRHNFREEGINPRDLMSRNDLVFIETKLLDEDDEHEEDKFDLFLSHLKEDSNHSEEQQIKRMEQNFF